MPTRSETSVPADSLAAYRAVTRLTDAFCRECLDEEYAELARRAARELCRRRPSLLAAGRPEGWACGIVHALGMANFLFDPHQTPHLAARAIYDAFGVSASGAGVKSRAVRETLGMVPMDPRWYRPSRMADNLLAWLVMVDGLTVDARHLSREQQRALARAGHLPFVQHLLLGEDPGGPAAPSPLDALDELDNLLGESYEGPITAVDAAAMVREEGARRFRRGSLPALVGEIIAAVTADPRVTPAPIDAACVRRPGRRPCGGRLAAGFLPDGRQIVWTCPLCGDTGLIQNWQSSAWDRGGRIGLPRVTRVRYWSGMLERLRDRQNLRALVLEGDAIPRSVVVAIHDGGLLEASGEHGDPFAARPLQYERLTIESSAGNADIVLHNRALALLRSDNDLVLRLHRCLAILADLARR